MAHTAAARGRLLAVAALCLLLATVVPSGSANAATGTVTGIVQLRETGVSAPFPGVTVSITPVGGTTPTAQVDTDSTGLYSLTAPPGDYVLRAEPPDASGLTPTERSTTITDGGTTTVDILFTAVESTLNVTGTITRTGGAPVAGATVTLAGTDGVSVETDASGSYSVEVLPRTFDLIVNAAGIDPFPERYALFADDLVIDTDLTLDVELPGAIVDIEVVDAESGAKIDGALVDGEANFPSGPSVLGQPSVVRSSFLDQPALGGDLSFFLPIGSFGLTANATDYEPGVRTNIAVPPTGVVRLPLVPEPDPGTVRFTGRLVTSDGQALAGAPISGEKGSLGTTGADGSFDVLDDSVPNDGNGLLLFDDPFPPLTLASLPDQWRIQGLIPHPDGQTIDLGDVVYDTEPVTFTVVDPDGVTVPGATLNGQFPTLFPQQQTAIGPYTGLATSRYFGGTVGPSGLTLNLVPTTSLVAREAYTLEFSPPQDVDSCTYSRYNLRATTVTVFVTGPDSVEVELRASDSDPFCDGQGPEDTPVSGIILLDGEPTAPRTFVGFLNPDGVRLGGVEVGTDGAFTSNLLAGEYGMDIIRTFPTDVWPELRIESTEPVATVTEGVPVDLGTFDVPLVDLDVTVLTPDGRPIPGVRVSTPDVGALDTVSFSMNGIGFEGYSRFRGSPVTDEQGQATLPLLASTYDLLFTPDTGFVPFRLENVVLPPGGSAVQVQLAFPHPPPTATIDLAGSSTGTDTYAGSVEVTVTPEAFDGFSPETVEVSVDGGPFAPYTGPFTVSAVGPHTVTVSVTDDGSVTGPPVSRSFTVEAVDEPDPTTPDPTTPDPTTPDPTTPDPTTPDPTTPDPTTVTTTPVTTTPVTTTNPTAGGESTTGDDSTTTTVNDPLDQTLPATGSSLPIWVPLLLLAAGAALVLAVRTPTGTDLS